MSAAVSFSTQMNRRRTIALIVCIVVIALLVAIIALNSAGPVGNLSVPNLIGKSETQAVSIAKSDGLHVKLIHDHSAPLNPPHADSVVAQSPSPRTHVSVGSLIQLTVYSP